MRFSNTLKSNQVHEWKDKYIAYDKLKKYMTTNKHKFIKEIFVELDKVNEFYFVLERNAVDEKDQLFKDSEKELGTCLNEKEKSGSKSISVNGPKDKKCARSDDETKNEVRKDGLVNKEMGVNSADENQYDSRNMYKNIDKKSNDTNIKSRNTDLKTRDENSSLAPELRDNVQAQVKEVRKKRYCDGYRRFMDEDEHHKEYFGDVEQLKGTDLRNFEEEDLVSSSKCADKDYGVGESDSKINKKHNSEATKYYTRVGRSDISCKENMLNKKDAGSVFTQVSRQSFHDVASSKIEPCEGEVFPSQAERYSTMPANYSFKSTESKLMDASILSSTGECMHVDFPFKLPIDDQADYGSTSASSYPSSQKAASLKVPSIFNSEEKVYDSIGEEESGKVTESTFERNLNFFRIPRHFERRKREKVFHELMDAISRIRRYREINYTGFSKAVKYFSKTYPNYRIKVLEEGNDELEANDAKYETAPERIDGGSEKTCMNAAELEEMERSGKRGANITYKELEQPVLTDLNYSMFKEDMDYKNVDYTHDIDDFKEIAQDKAHKSIKKSKSLPNGNTANRSSELSKPSASENNNEGPDVKKLRNRTKGIEIVKKYKYVLFHVYFLHRLNSTYFYKSKRIDLLQKTVKDKYKSLFAKDDPKKAQTVFKKIGRKRRADPVASFFAGVFEGSSLITLLMHNSDLLWSINLLYYSCFLFGLCLLLFRYQRINYKFIFNFDMCSTMNLSRYFLLVSALSFVNSAGFYVHKLCSDLDKAEANEQALSKSEMISRHSDSFSWIIYTAVFLQLFLTFFPMKHFFYKSRMYFISVITKVCFLPLSLVRFRHFYFADVCLSIAPVLKNITSSLLTTNCVILLAISLYFPIIRLLQCWSRYKDTEKVYPHIFNGGKYLVSILFVVCCFMYDMSCQYCADNAINIAGLCTAAPKDVALPENSIVDSLYRVVNHKRTFEVFKMILGALATIISLTWDIAVDWMLPRQKRMFPRYVYYFAVLFNVYARCLWIVNHYCKLWVVIILGSEITRRFVWTLLRVECEHLNNCSDFKHTKRVLLMSGELFYKKDYNPPGTSQETETGDELVSV